MKVGRLLLAYQRGEDTPEALAGAMFDAQFKLAVIGTLTKSAD